MACDGVLMSDESMPMLVNWSAGEVVEPVLRNGSAPSLHREAIYMLTGGCDQRNSLKALEKERTITPVKGSRGLERKAPNDNGPQPAPDNVDVPR